MNSKQMLLVGVAAIVFNLVFASVVAAMGVNFLQGLSIGLALTGYITILFLLSFALIDFYEQLGKKSGEG